MRVSCADQRHPHRLGSQRVREWLRRRPHREPRQPVGGAQVPRVPAGTLCLGGLAARKAPLREAGRRCHPGGRGDARRRRCAGDPGRELHSFHYQESSGCGRRRRGPPRAQGRSRDRPPGPRAAREVCMNIPMVDPAAEYRELKAEIDAAVSRVFTSGRFVLGPEGEGLERELAEFLGARHAVGCNSGTDALHLPLVAAGIGAGDEVVIPGFTFFATGEAVSYTGATPVFADVDAGTFNLDPASLSKSLTPRTKAVIAVHLFGQCAAIDEIAEICKAKSLVLVEDCAQCIGADYRGRRAGSWGDFGGFSFYPTKNLAAAGDAGLITANTEEHAKTLRMLRHHGSRQTYLHERVGWNSRLDELQAAVLRVKLRHLERFNEARRGVARRYREKLAGAKVTLPVEHGR